VRGSRACARPEQAVQHTASPPQFLLFRCSDVPMSFGNRAPKAKELFMSSKHLLASSKHLLGNLICVKLSKTIRLLKVWHYSMNT
jgi:hypothetical protein